MGDGEELRRHRTALVIGLLMTVGIVMAARLSGQPPAMVFSDQSSVAWVLVPVVVRDDEGYVKTLTAGDFRLLVDGLPVVVESFDAGADAAISLAFLQDLSGSMANTGKLAASQEAVRYFLERARPGDEFALATFASGRTQVEVPFTAELEVLEEAVSLWKGYGTTALHDAVMWLPDIHTSSRNLKRAALLVTDGDDNASIIAAAAARERVRAAELPVYVMALRDRRPLARRQTAPAARPLELLAKATGGRYFRIGGPADFKEACTTTAEELRYQYVLGFVTRSSGPETYHRLVVEVVAGSRRPSWRLSHRQGYRGFAPGAP